MLALRIDEQVEFEFYHILARPCSIEQGRKEPYPTVQGDDLHNFLDYNYPTPNGWSHELDIWSHMLATCQASDQCEPYAHRIELREPYAIELDGLIYATKLMRKIHKHMARAREELGDAIDYADYVGRFARAIGAKRIVYPLKTGHASGCAYRAVSIGEGVDYTRCLIHTYTHPENEE